MHIAFLVMIAIIGIGIFLKCFPDVAFPTLGFVILCLILYFTWFWVLLLALPVALICFANTPILPSIFGTGKPK